MGIINNFFEDTKLTLHPYSYTHEYITNRKFVINIVCASDQGFINSH